MPSWSLCAELLFYFSFPLLVPLFNRIAGRWLWRSGVAILAILAAVLTVILLVAADPLGTINVPGVQPYAGQSISQEYVLSINPEFLAQPMGTYYTGITYWLTYAFPLTRLLEFWLGATAARLVLSGRWKLDSLMLPIGLLLAAYVVSWFIPTVFTMSFIFLVPMTMIIATCARRDLAGRSRWLSHRRMLWAGNISFAFYMAQFPVMAYAVKFIFAGKSVGFGGWLLAVVGCLVVTTVVSHLVYHRVDAPLMKWVGRRFRPRGARTG